MKHIPSSNIFKEPEGYFDDLFDKIHSKNKARKTRVMVYRLAVAAVLVIGISLAIFLPDSISENNFQTQLDQEVELYINSGYWEAEDVLVLSEDPDELLDLILAEEWSAYSIVDEQAENEILY